MDDLLQDSVKELKKILADKKNKSAVAGATLGYLLSKNNKERNAILGGLAGYFLGQKKDDDEATDSGIQIHKPSSVVSPKPVIKAANSNSLSPLAT